MPHCPDILFDDAFRSLVADTLRRCRYAKDLEHLLRPETGFHARLSLEAVRLENYYLDADSQASQFTGICYELAYHVGQFLSQQLGSQYVFMAADGNCPQFYFEDYTNHTFILAFPQDTSALIMPQVLQATGNIPAGVFVIDPSFGIGGEANADSAVDGYRLKIAYDFEAIRPGRDRCEVLPFQWVEGGYGQTHTLPIGLSQQVLSGLSVVEAGLLLVIGFQITPESRSIPRLLLGSKQSTESYPVIRNDVEAELPPNHALKRFLDRIREGLAR